MNHNALIRLYIVASALKFKNICSDFQMRSRGSPDPQLANLPTSAEVALFVVRRLSSLLFELCFSVVSSCVLFFGFVSVLVVSFALESLVRLPYLLRLLPMLSSDLFKTFFFLFNELACF